MRWLQPDIKPNYRPRLYTLPWLEDILQKVNGAKIYSVLDLEDAYLHVAFRRRKSMIDHYFHAPWAFCLHQDAVRHFCHLSNFSGGHRLCSSRHSVNLCISRQYSHQCSNKKHPWQYSPKSQGATHGQQLPIKHMKVSDWSFKGQFLSFLLANSKLPPNPECLLALTQLPLPSNKDQ